MNIQIQFISVDVEDKGKYKQAEVTYKDLVKGQTTSKKLMSFSNPVVYKTLVDAKKGEIYDVELSKNDKGYWDWINVKTTTSVNTKESSPDSSVRSNPSPKSTYETPEERAKRQVLIVRQSSLSSALEYLNGTGAIKKSSAQDVTICAQEFYNWVFEINDQTVPLSDLPPFDPDDDIPV